MAKTKTLLIGLCCFNVLNIRQLYSYLSKKGKDVKVLFFLNENKKPTIKEYSLLAGYIKSNNFDLIGISIASPYFYIATRVTEIVRENSNAVVLFGGIQPTLEPTLCLKYADVVCIGDGEQPINELIDSMGKGKINYHIKNLQFNKDGDIIKNEIRRLDNPNNFAFTDFGDNNKVYIANNRVYHHNIMPVYKDYYYIMTARGCPFECTYCCNSILKSLLKKKGNYMRRRTVDNVIDELKIAKKKYNPKLIYFYDDVFTYDLDWIKEFSEKYKREINISFSCYTDPRCCQENILKLLVDAGLSKIDMGIQSGSERIRKEYYNRHDTNEQIIKLSKLFKKYGLYASYNLIIENPYETEEDMGETLRLLLKMSKPVRTSIASLGFFPTYPLTLRAINDKYIKEEDVLKNLEIKTLSTRYHRTVSLERDKTTMFWNLLYVLVMLNVPNKIIIKLSYSNLVRKNVYLITYVLDKTIRAHNYLFYQLLHRTIADRVKTK